MSRANLVEWSNSLSTEELHARVESATIVIDKFFTDIETKSEDEMWKLYEAAGYTKAQFDEAYPIAKKQVPQFKSGMSRKTSVVNRQSLELVTALRDAGGLMWGGTELTESSDNGDFMHFDCRNEPMAQKIIHWSFSAKGKKADTEGKATADGERARIKEEAAAKAAEARAKRAKAPAKPKNK